jgi:hypothetical protein
MVSHQGAFSTEAQRELRLVDQHGGMWEDGVSFFFGP